MALETVSTLVAKLVMVARVVVAVVVVITEVVVMVVVFVVVVVVDLPAGRPFVLSPSDRGFFAHTAYTICCAIYSFNSVLFKFFFWFVVVIFILQKLQIFKSKPNTIFLIFFLYFCTRKTKYEQKIWKKEKQKTNS